MRLMDCLLTEDFKTQLNKFVKDGNDKDIVKSYFNYFRKLKDKYPAKLENANINIDVPKEKRKDIDSYKTFNDIEKIVDYLRGQIDIEEPTVEVTNDSVVYEDNKIKISRGTSPRSCITIRGSETPSWCVARSDINSNLYYSYRLGGNESTFYFVRDKTKNKTDSKYYFFVIQLTKDGNFIVTSAENDGDTPMSWGEIVKIVPSLKKLKNIFKYYKVTSDERISNNFSRISDDSYKVLTYPHKKLFIDGGHKLEGQKFYNTPEDLLIYYVNLGNILSSEQEEYIKKHFPKLHKRYQILFDRKVQNNQFIKDLIKFNEFMKKRKDTDVEPPVDLSIYVTPPLTAIRIKNWYNDSDLYLKGDIKDILKDADLEWEDIQYVRSVISYHDVYIEHDELNYMYNYLSDENVELIKRLFTIMGVKKSIIDKISEEDVLIKILDKWDFSKRLIDEFSSQLAYAREQAEQLNAEELIKDFNALPLDFEEDEVEVTDILDFANRILAIDPTINNFSDAIFALVKKTTIANSYVYQDISYSGDEDTTELNRVMTIELERAIEEVMESSFGPYFERIEKSLSKMGFENDRIESDLVSILVYDKEPKDVDEITAEMMDDPLLEVIITNKKTGKKEQGIIKLSSIPNYLYNYKLFEETGRLKKLMII